MPREQRLRVAREVRKTHFILGTADYGYSTTQHSNHPGYAASPTTIGLENKRKTQKSHLNLCDAAPTDGKTSEFRAKYQPHDLRQTSVTLSKDTKDDLRRHHFVLGGAADPLQSSMRSAFPTYPSPVQSTAAIQLLSKTLRKHNFELGNKDYPFASTSKLDFTPKKTDGWGKEEKLIQFRRDLRASHFRYGGNPQSYVSLSQKDFSPKQYSARNPAHAPLGDNFVLGTSEEAWKTTAQTMFPTHSVGRPGLSSDRLTDLRASHFTLGNQGGNYQTTSTDNFVKHAVTAVSPVTDVGLRKSHFVLGNEGNLWSTVYQETHLGKGDGLVVAQRDRNADKASHLVMGADPAPMVSQTAATYQPHSDAKPGRLDGEVAKDLRTHHFQLGGEQREFTRTSSDYAGLPAEPGVLDPDLKKDLRSHHFTYGRDGAAVVSHNQLDYPLRQGQPARLESDRKADLRRSHFGIGSGDLRGESEYKGKYHWVQPVADSDYHFTID